MKAFEQWSDDNNEVLIRVVDLDGPVDEDDPAIITLRMLLEMHDEMHSRWKITPYGGAWNYEKA